MKEIRTWEQRLIDHVDDEQILAAIKDEIAELRAERVSNEALEKLYRDLHKKFSDYVMENPPK